MNKLDKNYLGVREPTEKVGIAPGFLLPLLKKI